MKQTTVKDLKRGEYFCVRKYDDSTTEVKSSAVWVRGEYVPSLKKFSCYKFDDVNDERFFKGDKVVFGDIYF